MNFSDWMKRFAYSSFLVKAAQFLNVRAFMRRLYYLLASPRGRIKKILFNGIDAQFYVGTPLELQLIKTPFKRGMGDERFF